jgi:hypothetical protein
MKQFIYEFSFSPEKKEEFEFIQAKAWSIAIQLNPKAKNFGFNINSTYQCEIYPENDFSPKEDWNSDELTWNNFISLFPEYVTFCEKYNFYKGCTIIGRPIYCAHRHGFGEHTITYPFSHCDNVKVTFLTPVNIDQINEQGIHWLKNNEKYNIDYVYSCKTKQPFILKADHFHKTSDKPEFIDGKTLFTVWHELSTFNENDVVKLISKLSK